MEIFVVVDIAAGKQIGIASSAELAKALVHGLHPEADVSWRTNISSYTYTCYSHNHLNGEFVCGTSNLMWCCGSTIYNDKYKYIVYSFQLKL